MRGGSGHVRVGAGELRGRRLAVPRGVRPTEGRVREALFSIWQERLSGARFLDLFAGSGAAGIEALSRGAAAALFVEREAGAARLLARNLRTVGIGSGRVRRAALPAALPEVAAAGPFDLVFADPPYRFDHYRELLDGIAPLLAPAGELAVEHSSRTALPAGTGELVAIDSRRYGETRLTFYRLSAPGEAARRR